MREAICGIALSLIRSERPSANSLGVFNRQLRSAFRRLQLVSGPMGPAWGWDTSGSDLGSMLPRCEKCTGCLRSCPSGAIARERFLLRAENCLTYHNEAQADFPAWIDPSWHHCLIGCMRCQDICPENKSVLGRFDDRAEFSEEETACFLDRVPFDRLPDETAAKMRDLKLNEDYRILCRNLSMLLPPQSALGKNDPRIGRVSPSTETHS